MQRKPLRARLRLESELLQVLALQDLEIIHRMSASASLNRKSPDQGTVSLTFFLFTVSATRPPRVVGGTARFGTPYLWTKKPLSLFALHTPVADFWAAFILYRQHHQQNIIRRNPGLNNPDISKIIGEQWKAEGDREKKVWQDLAQVSEPFGTPYCFECRLTRRLGRES